MNESQREASKELRAMSSAAAADWVISNHPKDGCFFISKRSWRVDDQYKLAYHFLSSIPHASDNCYVQLLSVMSVSNFLKVIESQLERSKSSIDLLSYYVLPALENAGKTEKDNYLIKSFRQKLQ